MDTGKLLAQAFYDRPVLTVARDLLGKQLVRMLDGERLSGTIIETEAYDGMQDLACHARVGKTPRTSVMFGLPGMAYVYFTYGMHWCLNAVTGSEGYPAAVLIRAVLPQEGRQVIAVRRAGRAEKEWCSGPARLTSAFGIDGACNNFPLFNPVSGLWIEDAAPVSDESVTTGPRVGIASVPEPWRSKPWRFRLKV